MEELRLLVASVQNTATRVAYKTTAQVDSIIGQELLAASTEQLREISETGRSVLDITAARINDVSSQRAQESASVARQSLQAADSPGLQAVQKRDWWYERHS